MGKLYRGWWADELLSVDCHLNIPSVIDAQSFGFPRFRQRIEFGKAPHVSSAPSPSRRLFPLPLALYRWLLSLVGKINVNFYAWFMASHLFFWEEALPPVWPGFIWIQLLAKMPRRWFCRSNCRRSRSSAARDPLTPKAQYTRHPALHSRAVKHICQRAIKNWQRRRQQTAAKRRRRRQV